MSRARLVKLLEEKVGFGVAVATVRAYENGDRKPTPAFIVAVAVALGLDDAERDALVEAALGDLNEKFLAEYAQAVKALYVSSVKSRQFPED